MRVFSLSLMALAASHVANRLISICKPFATVGARAFLAIEAARHIEPLFVTAAGGAELAIKEAAFHATVAEGAEWRQMRIAFDTLSRRLLGGLF